MCDSCCEQLEGFTHKRAVSTQWPVWELNRDLLPILVDTHTHARTHKTTCLLVAEYVSIQLHDIAHAPSLRAPTCSQPSSLPWCGGALPLRRPARVRLMNSIHQSPIPLIAANPLPRSPGVALWPQRLPQRAAELHVPTKP